MIAVALANFFLRTTDPLHELTWTMYDYHFATVLLGPVVAALACWEAIRLAPAFPMLEVPRDGEHRFVGLAWASLTAWVIAAYLVGLVVVVAVAKLYGTPRWPALVDLVAIVPPLGMLALVAAIGFVAGWRRPSWFVVPMIAGGTFAGVIGAYMVQMAFVRVGGATASLVGLAPRPDVAAAQAILYAGSTYLVIELLSRDAGRRPASVAAAIVVVVAGVFLAGVDSTLEPAALDLVCSGRDPEVCLSVEYEPWRSQFEAPLDRFLEGLEHVGVAPPARLTQARDDLGPGVGFIPALYRIEDDPGGVVTGAVSNAFVGRCASAARTPEELDRVFIVVDWVETAYHRSVNGRLQGPPDAVVQAIAELESCR